MIRVEGYSEKRLEQQEKIRRIKERGFSPGAIERIVATAQANLISRQETHTAAILDAAANARRPELVASE